MSDHYHINNTLREIQEMMNFHQTFNKFASVLLDKTRGPEDNWIPVTFEETVLGGEIKWE